MNENFERIRKSVNWGGKVKRLNLLVVLALVLSLVIPTVTSLSRASARVQPLLLEMTAQQPDQVVSVIVQKTAEDGSVEAAVTQLGGTITKDLHVINAFAAEIEAKDVPQLASLDGVRWVSLDAPVQQSDMTDVFTTWATITGTVTPMGFTNAAAMLDFALGPNNTYGYSDNTKGAFGGFVAEVTPGNAISKVEIVLRAYTPNVMLPQSDTDLTLYVSGVAGRAFVLSQHAFDTCVGADQACTVYVDVTSDHAWKWTDFDNGLELLIDQSRFSLWDKLYYDAVGLRVTSTPGVDTTGDTGGDTAALASVDTSQQANFYNQIIRSSDLWNTNKKVQGKGVTVAVVDSGVYRTGDLGKRVRVNANFNGASHFAIDRYGHGTFVASIVAGSGSHSGHKYVGVAPRADIVNVRVSDDQGMSTESDVINGLQWVLDNRARYNIRVVNLSLNSSVAQSYHTSPLDAACEILWFNGIVVVVSAGNNGTVTLFPPANDPFVITIGATEDKGTLSTSDDVVATFSAYGTTESGFAKPELVVPGKNIIAFLPSNKGLTISVQHPSNRVDDHYFRMSGTSVAAPMVSGAVALLLQDEPNLNPDQVKYRLMATANKNWPGYNATTTGAGYLDVYAAVNGTTTQTANTGITASQLLWTGSTPPMWDSIQWGSVQWGSVQWGSVQWGSDYWGP